MSYGSLDLKNIHDDDIKDKSVVNNVNNVRGLSVLSTTLFIAGEMTGSGILALPKAIVNTGYIGIVLLVVFCINAAYGGIRLGNCWNIVEERYPEHRVETRNPYSVIALKAVGKWGSTLVSNCIRFTLFGAGTVYLLLSAQIIQSLLRNVVPNISSCLYFLIIAVCLIPVMWLSSPKDFTLVGLGAILSTVVACILYFIQILIDAKNNEETVKHQVHGFRDFFFSFGTILFAFGVGGYFVYGEKVESNITLSLTKSPLVDIGNILMAIHLVFAFLIVVNPVCQDVEETFGVPKTFNWKRCGIRTLIAVLMIIVGETIPQFGLILSLVGGSTITLVTFVLPPYFYMKLCDKQSHSWERRKGSDGQYVAYQRDSAIISIGCRNPGYLPASSLLQRQLNKKYIS
ncbi:hypothetical protein NQ314_001900 [Rhamnusium bicolor]|uniref:Amino acid transporter transmembrane domain-containing protein n=1 Tax=Rhamnusium bicolor TaxID=1586634 RepID=A0AAV8ZR09_9CUCU|nr:hypothetical protein NQ314_001900 [Rhamnusium bicolor]